MQRKVFISNQREIPAVACSTLCACVCVCLSVCVYVCYCHVLMLSRWHHGVCGNMFMRCWDMVLSAPRVPPSSTIKSECGVLCEAKLSTNIGTTYHPTDILVLLRELSKQWRAPHRPAAHLSVFSVVYNRDTSLCTLTRYTHTVTHLHIMG